MMTTTATPRRRGCIVQMVSILSPLWLWLLLLLFLVVVTAAASIGRSGRSEAI